METVDLNFKKFDGHGPALVILHGVFGSLDNWVTLGKQLADLGTTVYLLDQRNHGRSPHIDLLDYPSMANDLKKFLSDQGISSPILIGHSMGGKTVMQFAATWPDALTKLVVADIGPKAYKMHHEKLIRGMQAINIDSLTSRQEADETLAKYEPSHTVRQFVLKNLYRTEDGKYAWRFNLEVIARDMPKIGLGVTFPKPFDKPTLFIKGGNSDYVLQEDWPAIEKIFPKAELKIIPDAGHWIHAEAPAIFIPLLMAFIRQA